MPNLIAIDWDVREARVVAGSLRGKRIRVEHAFRVAWQGTSAFDAGAAETRGAALHAALRERGLSRGDTLVTIGRSCVELKPMSLPPAPDAELPDMVRFLAQREFHGGADAALDFLPAPAAEGEPRAVLAATLDAAAVAQIRVVCDAAGLRLRRILLRPCATASAIAPNLPAVATPRLLVDAAAEEAELTALAGSHVVLLRSTRVPGDHKSVEYGRALTAEIRRTTASVQNQLAGRRIDSIVLCGARQEFTAQAERLTGELSTTVEVVDPWELLPSGVESAIVAPDDAARFAPLLGALADEADGVAPRFDFLNPRRPPVPPNRRVQVLAGALAATIVIALVFGIIKWKLAGLDAEIETAKVTAKALDLQVKTATELERRAGKIDEWARSDVSWLAELARLSQLAPGAQQMMLTQLRAVAAAKGGGDVQLTGLASDSSAAAELDVKLRDPRHEVSGKSRERVEDNGKYPWRFRTDMFVKGESTSATPPATVARQGGR